MNFRSYDDLVELVRRKQTSLPPDISLVVFVPRSGILPAAQIALQRNLPLVSLDDFLDRKVDHGTFGMRARHAQGAREGRVLIVDDSVGSGLTLGKIREALQQADVMSSRQVDFLAVYWSGRPVEGLDHWFEIVPFPRVFEWNLFHHKCIQNACVDIDGVLCPDPGRRDNDDGPRYRKFIADAPALVRPTLELGWLVTSRLEKYREATEAWLARNSIRYRELVMLGDVSAQARKRSKAHGFFKGRFFSQCEADMFIESDPFQAYEIAQLSGKSAICTSNWLSYHPEMNRIGHYNARARHLLTRSLRLAVRNFRRGTAI